MVTFASNSNHMHARFLLLPTLAIAATTLWAANPLEVPSSLTSAKVFLQGAQVLRTASTTLPAGNSTVVFTGLAQGLDPQSIQVTGKGNYTILSVNHRLNYLSESSKKKELEDLVARMKKMDKDIGYENAMLSVWANEEQLLAKNASVGGQQNGVTPGQLTAVNDYIRDRLRIVKAGQLTQQDKLAALQEEKAKLQQQIAVLQPLAQRPTSEVVVEINSPTTTGATFTLDYFVNQAGWTPAYDLRAKGTGQPIQLLMKASVTNNTGEDWDKVSLSLSSGNPTMGGIMPALYPWILYVAQPLSAPKQASTRKMTSGAELSEVVTSEKYYDAIRGPVVNASQQATTVEYAIAVPFTIPSDALPHTLAVQEQSLPATYTYYATPKLDKTAFLYARTTGWEEMNLLSGEANIFFEGTFVGKSQLQLDAAKDTIDISLGRDKGVVVERVKRKATDQKAWVGGNRTATVGWDLTVRNAKNTTVELDLMDQYPLSAQGEVDVKLTDKGGAAVDTQKGLLTWHLTLAPKETKQTGFTYTVKHPKELPVVLE